MRYAVDVSFLAMMLYEKLEWGFFAFFIFLLRELVGSYDCDIFSLNEIRTNAKKFFCSLRLLNFGDY